MAENETFQAAAYSSRGTAREAVTLPSEQFDGVINMPVMHQAVKAFLANQRQGNAATKTRGFVIGGNQKPWKQKGTGRARQGSIRAPNFVGGGTVFGPQPRDYTQRIHRKVKALARKSAFNARARENALIVIDAFNYNEPKTRQFVGLFESLGVADRKVLVLTDGIKPNVYLSGRNLQNVLVMPYADASTYHILWSDVVLVESAALGESLEPIAGEEAAPAKTAAKKAPARKAAAKKTAAKKTAAKKSAAKKTAEKKAAAPRKSAARKSAAKGKNASGGSKAASEEQ
ncbi:MAG TPA: 50S ribosomal protein L4 [Gemmatimonadales bacterium]|nr:50S ribosomal protein L4 [Gemmatimonadales bacterium]